MKDEEHDDYCWAHHTIEQPGYLRCGECLHWFANEATLEADFNAMCDQLDMIRIVTADEIFFCPHCAHDF